ncbi:similar to Saccharomyces cerevisiae YOR354C MSC6 Protein of unknown function [Maudiozyma saulgeensis]|uniref:Mitochondrial group I intron splicing factor CCM1 n=1 Tax=Maudiozyma saulgeensis TaxID=1789683 RepID=A0A1X7R5G0_9SACH|nr:similar to Saccharomyces cerevisiae YOR354C MSC6 Protein of unknown function [Kazachstania saulgeensis]
MLNRTGLLKNSLRQFSTSIRSLQTANGSTLTFNYNQNDLAEENKNQNKQEQKRPIHPLSELGDRLNQELKDQKDINDVYTDFKDSIMKFKKSNYAESRLQKSFGLNGLISRLIQTSITSKNSNIDPYEILTNVCDSHLARPQHFEIVMEYFLSHKLPQDVMSLWIKYLSLITENPDLTMAFRGRDPHKNIVALTTVAYLLLPNNDPDMTVLNQILQVKDVDDVTGNVTTFDNTIPINLITPTILQRVNKKDQSVALKNFEKLFIKYVSNNVGWLNKELDNSFDLRIIQNYYNLYKNNIDNIDNSEFNPDILANFMNTFVTLKRPNQAVKCYNDFKPIFKDDLEKITKLNNALLITVAELPANSKVYKLTRIQAIWNSLIKNNESIDAGSYISLFKALFLSKNLEELEIVWEEEVPEVMKKEQDVLEAYLDSVLRLKNSVTLQEIEQKLPQDLKNINLINSVLLKNIQSPDFKMDSFDGIYDKYFGIGKMSNGMSKQLPNTETLAIKMLASYTASNDKTSFNFIKSINIDQRSDFNRFLKVVEDFINVSPNITPVRALFTEIQQPLNSRKYKLFITAEFMKKEGSSTEAEALLRYYLDKAEIKTDGKSSLKAQFIRELLDSLTIGFCQLSLRKKSFQFVSKINEYYRSMKEVNPSIGNSTLVTILHTYAMLCRYSKQKLNPNEITIIQSFLGDLQKQNFHVNQADIRILTSAGLKVPETLIKSKPSKKNSEENDTTSNEGIKSDL